MVKKKRDFQEVTAMAEPLATEEATSVSNLRASLEEVKTYDGVIGYILRNSTSAAIDLKDPMKIIDYAIISSSALNAGEELSRFFDLGEVKDMLVEGKNIKMLSITVGENKVSVFMEKNVNHESICKELT